jgi:RNA recognition motif-containing protein
LRAVFAPHGTIVSVAVIKDRDTQQSKGFGFVEMEKDEEAQEAIKALDGSDVGGRSIIVNVARPQEPRTGGGFGGGFGGGNRGGGSGGYQKRY